MVRCRGMWRRVKIIKIRAHNLIIKNTRTQCVWQRRGCKVGNVTVQTGKRRPILRPLPASYANHYLCNFLHDKALLLSPLPCAFTGTGHVSEAQSKRHITTRTIHLDLIIAFGSWKLDSSSMQGMGVFCIMMVTFDCGVSTIGRFLKNISLFCRIASLL